jgi:hypothetical protein
LYSNPDYESQIKKALASIVKNADFRNVPGIAHLRDIVEGRIPRENVVHTLDKCIEEIDKHKKSINNTIARVSNYSRIIENTDVVQDYIKSSKVEDPTIDLHIKKNIKVLGKTEMLTSKQISILEKTALKISDDINRTEVSGMSRHTVATVIIWIALMYHGKRVNLPHISTLLNSSKSTLGVRTRKWEQLLGFKKSNCSGAYGYLIPTRKASVLCKLGESVKFNESKRIIVQECVRELKIIAESSDVSSYIAARFVLLQMLIDNGKMTDENIKDAVLDYFKDAVGSQRHIRWNARNRNKKCISDSTTLINRDGNSLYISGRFVEYIGEVMAPINQFIELCNNKRFDRDRCKTSLDILCTRLDSLEKSLPDEVKVEVSKISGDDQGKLEKLIISMKLAGKKYREIFDAIYKEFPDEKRDLRNYVWKIWNRYKKTIQKKD